MKDSAAPPPGGGWSQDLGCRGPLLWECDPQLQHKEVVSSSEEHDGLSTIWRNLRRQEKEGVKTGSTGEGRQGPSPHKAGPCLTSGLLCGLLFPCPAGAEIQGVWSLG